MSHGDAMHPKGVQVGQVIGQDKLISHSSVFLFGRESQFADGEIGLSGSISDSDVGINLNPLGAHDVLELRSNSVVVPVDPFDSLHLTTAGRASDTRGCEEVPQTPRPSGR